MSELLWQKRIRNWAGALGGILPFLSLAGALLYDKVTGELPNGFWSDLSISATYYVTPALVGVLTAASLVLMCYDGYDLQDNIVTTISGVFGLMIVLFPCECAVTPDYTGYFQLPCKISNIIHCTSAVLFFCLLAYNDLFLFTKTDGSKGMTSKKKIRNIIYKVCGIGMLCAMMLMPLPFHFTAKIWWVETVALLFFAVSWLTKGGAFTFLNDE
jgi:hypothetical protein